MSGSRFLGLLLLLNSLLFAGCSSFEPPVALEGTAFGGSAWHIKLARLPAGQSAAAVTATIQAQLDGLNRIFSVYQPDSEIMRLNAAPVGVWRPVSADMMAVLTTAQRLSAETDGAFDITVGPLIELWGFGAQAETERVPSEAAIAAAKAQVGWRQLEVDPAGHRVRRLQPVRLDASSMVDGYAVDRLAAWLEQRGVKDYLVEVSGELKARGHKPGGKPWVLAIETADGLRGVERTLRVEGRGVSTSGDYHNYYERDGRRYSHFLDPVTGRPVTHALASVTVIDDSTLYADGLSTAFMVMGPARAWAMAAERKQPVFLIEHAGQGFRDRYNEPFAAFLETSP